MDWLDLLAVQGILKSLLQHHTQFKSISSSALTSFYGPALISIHNYWKNIALTKQAFVSKVMSLLYNMMSRFVIVFLPRSKHHLISWLQSPSAVILEPKKIKSVTVSIVSPSICHEVMGPDAWSLFLECWVLSQFFRSPLTFLLTFPKRLFISFHFLPLKWYHLHIWGFCSFSQESWFQLVLYPAQHFTWCTLHVS